MLKSVCPMSAPSAQVPGHMKFRGPQGKVAGQLRTHRVFLSNNLFSLSNIPECGVVVPDNK